MNQLKKITLIFLCQIINITYMQSKSIREIDSVFYMSNYNQLILSRFRKSELSKYINNSTTDNKLKIDYIKLHQVNNKLVPSLKLLLRLRKESKNVNKFIYMMSTFHLSTKFRSVNKMAMIRLMNEAKKINSELNYLPLQNELNEIYASYNFEEKHNYKKSIYYWRLSHKYWNNAKNKFKSTSILNNIALSYMKMNNINKAIQTYNYALNDFKKPKTKNDIFVLLLVKLNLANCYVKFEEFEKAYFLYNEFYEFCAKNEDFYSSVPEVTKNLIYINKKLNRKERNEKIIEYLKKQVIQINDHTIKVEFYNILFNFYLDINDNYQIQKYGRKLLLFQEKKNQLFIDDVNFINEQLTKTTISSLEESFQAQAKYEKQKSLAAYSIIALFLVSGSVYFYQKRKTDQKAEIILEKEEEIESIESDLLFVQQQQQQEKMLALQMNIQIKNATAQAFSEKLKELKRKKEMNTEDVIKELQVQINNLLSIDKKNTTLTEDTESEKKKFNDALRKLYPDLTNQELQLCNYYRMNLSAKEIATIEGITPGSARVYKNKIKNKLGLKQEDSVNEYLMRLVV